MNIAERIATVAAVQGVLAAFPYGEVSALGGNLHAQSVTWFRVSGDVASRGGGTLIVSGYNTAQESALWGELPAPLAPAPAAQGYITERTVPFTKTQVIAFANAQWRLVHATAPDILGIEVDNLDGKSVKVSGYFWTGEGARTPLTYIIRLVDPNGVTTGANVKLELVA